MSRDTICRGRFETIRHVYRSIERVTLPQSDRDRDTIVKLAFLSRRGLSEDWLNDALEAVRQIKPNNPMAYFQTCLVEGAEKHRKNLWSELARLDVAADVTAEINSRQPAGRE